MIGTTETTGATAAIERLAALAGKLGADAVALTPGPTFRRLFGADFHQHERPLAVIVRADGASACVAPSLERLSFEMLGMPGPVAYWRDEEGYAGAFAAAAAALGPLQRIAVEGQRMRVFERDALAAAFSGAVVLDAHRTISSLRLHKTDAEIDSLRRAIAVSERALERVLADLRIGDSERALSARLVAAMFAEGAEGLSFAPIVAGGPNSAQPHATPGERPIAAGDALLFDFGATVDGLNADITRTFFVGHVADEDAALYEVVEASNRVGREIARPGLHAGALDDACLRVLEASRFAAFVRTKTGHGLGLEVHEEPYILRGSPQALEPGMVFTVEPGLYRADRLGVRIEDDLVVTAIGAESLTTFSRSLRVVG